MYSSLIEAVKAVESVVNLLLLKMLIVVGYYVL